MPTPAIGLGTSVALSGNTLVIGAAGEDGSSSGVGDDQLDNSLGNAGAVFVFERTGSTWMQAAYVKASNTEAGDIFGTAALCSLPIPPGIAGIEVYAQAAMPQPGGSLELSNALAIEVCP